MYHRFEKIRYTVDVGEPEVKFGDMLLEQFGGAKGELAAAKQYTIQDWSGVDDPPVATCFLTSAPTNSAAIFEEHSTLFRATT